MRRVLICGDREWLNGTRIRDVMWRAQAKEKIDAVIEGECRGADKLGAAEAKRVGIPVLPFPALWSKHGKAAGPIRNQQMLVEGKPTEVWAFHNDIESSRGTLDMVTRARKAGLPVYLFTETTGQRMMPTDHRLPW